MGFCKDCVYCKTLKISNISVNGSKSISSYTNSLCCTKGNDVKEITKYSMCKDFLPINQQDDNRHHKTENSSMYLCSKCFNKVHCNTSFEVITNKYVPLKSVHPESVYLYCPTCHSYSNHFHVDYNMGKVIQLLNIRGYKTYKSSEGFVRINEIPTGFDVVESVPFIYFDIICDDDLIDRFIEGTNYSKTYINSFSEGESYILSEDNNIAFILYDTECDKIVDEILSIFYFDGYDKKPETVNKLIKKFNATRKRNLNTLYKNIKNVLEEERNGNK